MSIVSSVRVSETVQRDGRKSVHERHTDHLGQVYDHIWLAVANADLDALLAAWAVTLVAQLRDNEITVNLASVLTDGSLATLTFQHSTVAENRTALRTAYAVATRTEAIMIGDFLGSLTDLQLQTVFSLTAGQVTTLRTSKLTPAATAATSIRNATGA